MAIAVGSTVVCPPFQDFGGGTSISDPVSSKLHFGGHIRPSRSTVLLEGGHLALDFVNTIGGLRDQPPYGEDELLESYEDLLVWCVRLGVISDADSRKLGRRPPATRRPLAVRSGARTNCASCSTRPSARSRTAPSRPPSCSTSCATRTAAPWPTRAWRGTRWCHERDAWTWPPPLDLDDPLRPIAHAATELLTGGPLEHLKICANCRWLFLDKSRNHSRRWCSMQECERR